MPHLSVFQQQIFISSHIARSAGVGLLQVGQVLVCPNISFSGTQTEKVVAYLGQALLVAHGRTIRSQAKPHKHIYSHACMAFVTSHGPKSQVEPNNRKVGMNTLLTLMATWLHSCFREGVKN